METKVEEDFDFFSVVFGGRVGICPAYPYDEEREAKAASKSFFEACCLCDIEVEGEVDREEVADGNITACVVCL